MDVGVARPRAHGQAITRTAINFIRAEAKFPGSAQKYQIKKVITAIPTTIGTKIPEIKSAIRCIGAFEPWASSTILIICDKAVSFPTFVALIFKNPFLLIVAPMTLSPTVLSIGTLSPVIIDSSKEE